MWYIETSASIKLVAEEVESAALAERLEAWRAHGDPIVTSMLTLTEMHRSAVRLELDPVLVTSVLGQFSIVSVEDQDFQMAAHLQGHRLRSLDAIHVAVALRYRCDGFLSYDVRQIEAAVGVGLSTLESSA